MRRVTVAATAVAATLGIVACDQMTSPSQEAPPFRIEHDPFLLKGARTSGPPIRSPYSCALTYRTDPDAKFRRGLVVFRVPESAIAPDKAWLTYKLTVKGDSGEVMATANCIIPNTDVAIKYMDRHIAHNAGTRASGPALGSGVSASAYSDTVPMLATVYTVAPWNYWYGHAGYGQTQSYGDQWESSYTSYNDNYDENERPIGQPAPPVVLAQRGYRLPHHARRDRHNDHPGCARELDHSSGDDP